MNVAPTTSLQSYQELLNAYLSLSGEVDYKGWHGSQDDVAHLDRVLSDWQAHTPDSHPSAFGNASSRLSYWLNLYNGLVIREVIRHWPLGSVRDVQPTLLSKVVTLKGFFRDLHFNVGGQQMNLGDIENKVIRSQFKDARIHFAINCGSASCPVLRKDVFSGDSLERQLNDASKEFVGGSVNVQVRKGERVVVLSKIFKWYREDFERHIRVESDDANAGLIDFLRLFADGQLSADLLQAKNEGYKLCFMDYDWSVNAGV